MHIGFASDATSAAAVQVLIERRAARSAA